MPSDLSMPTYRSVRTCLLRFSWVSLSGSISVNLRIPHLTNISMTALPPEPKPATAMCLSFTLNFHSFSIWFLLGKVVWVKLNSPTPLHHSGNELRIIFQDFFYRFLVSLT